VDEPDSATRPRMAERNSTRLVIIITLVLIGIFALYLARDFLTPVISGALIAFLLAPLVRWLDRYMARWLAILLAYVIFIAGVIFLFFVFPVLFVQSIAEIDLAAIFASIDDWAISILQNLTTITIFGVTVDLSEITQPIITAIETTSPPVLALTADQVTALIAGALEATAGLFGVVASLVSFAVFTLLIALYLSGSGGRYIQGSLALFPPRHRAEAAALGRQFAGVWNDYIRGEFALMVIIGITTGVAVWIIGVPGAFVLGLIAGLLEVIPTFGPIIATIPAVLVALVQGSLRFETMDHVLFALLVIVVYILVQQLESQLVAPRVLGGAVQVPALVVLLAITVGFSVAGVLGAILAVPAVASGRVLSRYAWTKATGVNLIIEPAETDQTPAPTEPAVEPVSTDDGTVGAGDLSGR
jgi:predicted PurR-regulated permease PerM